MSILRCLLVAAVLVAPAGCAATPASPHAAPSAVRTRTPAGPAASPPAARPRAHGKGWTQDDIPQFGPAPAPERVVPAAAHGKVAYTLRVPTQQKVAFLTIDDGYLKHPEAPALLAAAHVPVTLFLTTDAIRDDPDYFRPLIDAGAVVEAHTISHPQLRGLPYTAQKHQICGSADQLATWYTRRPVLFRPPYGAKDDTTLRAANDCGMKAAFMWKETVDKGKVRYQGEHRVQPGDIILMHFRPAFVKDFLAALRAIKRAGLTPALLEDYVR
ncbi:polysaccharide deacetylase family protein [Actinoplanes sp. N902-109]|uniref:polysaccharide deacetylase family protein n=1 Tax=Actinoplanes sp. (strain N902-109) TaxID=649831 RepID=UPI0003295A60|nr:polysaccharide deacetylase family protein [Actinoplanes sp. N902-109]AGL17943.1 chitooligosaccharide deacetylase [Actinoplanes sp. N902-109]